MEWIDWFDFFLFDFDGLLVNTEPVHYQAYVNSLRKMGFDLDWDFPTFCSIAHKEADSLKEAIYSKFPSLYKETESWNDVYRRKKSEYLQLLRSAKINLMPGVFSLLEALEKKQIERVVVTHSPLEQVEAIKSSHPILKTIPHWITREDYEQPKPHPESYQLAIQKFGKNKQKIIGFEDSLRGLRALMATPALPVLVCASHHPLIEVATAGDILHFEYFDEINASQLKPNSVG